MDSVITKREAEFLGIAVGMPYRFRRDMPFIVLPAIGTAAAAISAATATATLATVGAAAVATIGAIGAVATVAGIGMSVVGMITGDKDLMKIGGIVGLAGGVGSIASGLALGAGGLSAAASADVTAAANASGANGINAAIGNSLTQVGSLPYSPTVDAVGGTMSNSASAANATTQGLTGQINTMLSSGGANAVTAGGQNLSANIANSALNGGTGMFSPTVNAVTENTLSSFGSGLAENVGATGGTTGGSFFDKLMSNPTAMMSGVKMVADGIGNMGNGKVRDAEANFYNSKAANFPLENAIANRKIDADIAKSEAELKLTQEKLADERAERDRKIANQSAIIRRPTFTRA